MDSFVALCHSLLPLSDQVLGLYWSWRQVGSPGMFTRIACCNIETLEVRVLFRLNVNAFYCSYTGSCDVMKTAYTPCLHPMVW